METIILQFLLEETETISLYTGGGDEPVYTCFIFSEDRDREDFLKSLSERLASLISTTL